MSARDDFPPLGKYTDGAVRVVGIRSDDYEKLVALVDRFREDEPAAPRMTATEAADVLTQRRDYLRHRVAAKQAMIPQWDSTYDQRECDALTVALTWDG